MLLFLLDAFFPYAASQPQFPRQAWRPAIVEESGDLRKRGIVWLDRMVAAGSYHEDDDLRRAIHALKYRGRVCESRSLAERFACVCAPFTDMSSAHMSPVPLHWTRRLLRGCNQSQLLTREIRSLTGAHIVCGLRRRRRTGHQTRLNRAERIEAMRRNPFIVLRCANVPETIALVDDVATTGATLDACAQAWKQAGAGRVEAWIMAYDKGKK